MFDKKYKKTLEILDDEIEMYHRMYRHYLALSDTSNEESKIWCLNKSSEYSKIFIALSELKEKLRKEIES